MITNHQLDHFVSVSECVCSDPLSGLKRQTGSGTFEATASLPFKSPRRIITHKD